nr:glycosyltransferase [uncultured Bacteroides sp.]
MKEQPSDPLISIIILVHNLENYIRECLISVIEQTYTNLEIIIINDGSTDRSSSICDEFAAQDKRINIIRQKNSGISYSRNIGLDNAHGAYIGFVDGDDWIEKDMYETLLGLMVEYNADISMCSHFLEFNNATKANSDSGEILVFNNKEAVSNLLDDTIIKNYLWEKLYKRELFIDIRFPIGQTYEDMATQYRLFYNSKKTVSLSSPKYHYRIRKGSVTNNPSSLIDESQYLQALHNQFQFAINKNITIKKPARPMKSALHLIDWVIISGDISSNMNIIDGALEIAHQYDKLKINKIGFFYALRRYFIYNYFNSYSSVNIFYRKLFPKKK